MNISITKKEVVPTFMPVTVSITLLTALEVECFKHIVGCWQNRTSCSDREFAAKLAQQIWEDMRGVSIELC